MVNEASDVNSNNIVSKTKNLPSSTDILADKVNRKYVGEYKQRRKINRNSIQNLKQCRDNPDLTDIIFAKYVPKKSDLGSKILTGLLILALMAIGGWIIWKIYKQYRENKPK